MVSTVLLSRTRAEPLGTLLEGLGLAVVHRPLVERRWTEAAPPSQDPEVVVITSAFTARLPGLAKTLGRARVLAVGGATARALWGAGISPHRVGEAGGGELIESFEALQPVGGQVLWFVGAKEPAAPTKAAFEGWPGPIHHWAVYETHPAAPLEATELEGIAVVEISSPSAARALARLGLELPPLVAIGPTTAAAARAAGLELAGVASSPDAWDLARLLAEVAAKGSPQPG